MSVSVKQQETSRGVPRSVRHARGDAPHRGFTLIEMLVVFSLLALLLSIAVPRYTTATEKAGQKVRAQNLATLRDAIDKFKADQGRYPAELPELVAKHYLRSLPLDPVSGSYSWTALPHPGALEPGIYDVGPPGLTPDLQPVPGQAAPVPALAGSSAARTLP